MGERIGAALERVPVIDLSPFRHGDSAARQAVARAVDRANREIGFLMVTGHSVDPQLLQRWFDVSRRFFERPLAEKLRCEPEAPEHHHGYHRTASSGLAAKEGEEAPPDLREYFMVGRPEIDAPYFHTPAARRFHRANRWPAEPAAFEATARACYASMERLGATLMRIFAVALDLPEDWFAPRIDRHFSVLSTIWYPAQRTPPLPGQLRAGAHTDYGSLTILVPTEAPGGLQVLLRDGRWTDVPYLPGAFVINIGDMMQRWTNDRWLSNFHRVVNPPTGGTPQPRQSVAFFLHPNHDTEVACIPTCHASGDPPRYAPVLAGDYMWEKEHAIAGAAMAERLGRAELSVEKTGVPKAGRCACASDPHRPGGAD